MALANRNVPARTDKQQGGRVLPFRPGHPAVLPVAILIPLKRRHRIGPVKESIHNATPSRHRVMFICDKEDEELISTARLQGGWVLEYSGNYAQKINEGVRQTDEPLIFTGADDLEFHKGWLEAACAKLSPGVGVVGTNDLCNQWVVKGLHSTHSLVTREYAEQGTVDEPDKLLHEGYEHEWVDNEFVETAMQRAAYVHAQDAVVEHLHPLVKKAPMDELYAQMPRRMREGERLFTHRRPLWMT